MRPSRLFLAVIMMFWVLYLALLALVVTYAPQGGVKLAGLILFEDAGLVEATISAMTAIGLSATVQGILLGLVSGLNFAGAGLALFAMMFCVLGEAAERRDAQPLAEGAAVCVAVASALVMLTGFAGGQAGILMALELAAFGGLGLVVMAIGQASAADRQSPLVEEQESLLDDVIADHAATHAAFSAQLASLSQREQRT